MRKRPSSWRNGSSSVELAQPASDPPIDCFYVYPTVSSQLTVNANEEIGPEEKQVAIDQASRFSQQCRVYAPIYRQLTLHALESPEGVSLEAFVTAYLGVVAAFNEYLTKYNDGRGFVLIGHSQGALMLKQLIKAQIDPSPALRDRLVSAVLLGGNVLVPKGATVGGDFANVPACQAAAQIHCVVAYSSFLQEPPVGADFGRVGSPLLGPATAEQIANEEVLCVNPTLPVQGAGAGALLRYEATTPLPLPGFTAPHAPTPWVSMPGQYSAQCDHANGASWLQLNDVGPIGRCARTAGRSPRTTLGDAPAGRERRPRQPRRHDRAAIGDLPGGRLATGGTCPYTCACVAAGGGTSITGAAFSGAAGCI